jgi:hypothetical protein
MGAAGLTEPRCASERGLAMGGGRPAERRFTVGGRGKSLREQIGDYDRAVSETVDDFDGFVAKYMGDGVLVYFG